MFGPRKLLITARWHICCFSCDTGPIDYQLRCNDLHGHQRRNWRVLQVHNAIVCKRFTRPMAQCSKMALTWGELIHQLLKLDPNQQILGFDFAFNVPRVLMLHQMNQNFLKCLKNSAYIEIIRGAPSWVIPGHLSMILILDFSSQARHKQRKFLLQCF